MSAPADFEAAMRAQGPKIYTLAVRLAGNAADGQDLAQETFLHAYKAWGKFRGDSDVGTWFYRICINCWKNRVRYEKRRSFWKHFSLDRRPDNDETPAPELPSNEAPLGKSMEEVDQRALLHRGLDKLEPQDRAILILREMEDRSYEEIADMLEIPVGTVRSRLSRSREKLREVIQEELHHG